MVDYVNKGEPVYLANPATGLPYDSTTPLPVDLPTVDESGLATAAKQDAAATLLGAVTEAAPASDTASSGLNGRLQRIAQRITSLIALIPTSLGSKTTANSFAVALATDEPLLGSLTEAAPASDTASSGINGRLQRIAQRLTSLMTGIVLSAGSAIIGKVGIDQTTPGSTNAVNVVPTYKASKSLLTLVGAANNNAQTLAGGNRQLLNVLATNRHATNWAYFKFFNKASTPTVGTDTPLFQIPVPPNSTVAWTDPEVGQAFSLGIGIAITTGYALLDNTAVANAGDVLLNMQYV